MHNEKSQNKDWFVLRKQPSFFAPGPSGVSRTPFRLGAKKDGCFRRLTGLRREDYFRSCWRTTRRQEWMIKSYIWDIDSGSGHVHMKDAVSVLRSSSKTWTKIDFQLVPFKKKVLGACLKNAEEMMCTDVLSKAWLLTGRPLQN